MAAFDDNDKVIDIRSIEKAPDVDGASPTGPRLCSFCHEMKNVRVTPDGTPTHEIGICNDCAMRAVAVCHNYMVQYVASLLRSNEALRRSLSAHETKLVQ